MGWRDGGLRGRQDEEEEEPAASPAQSGPARAEVEEADAGRSPAPPSASMEVGEPPSVTVGRRGSSSSTVGGLQQPRASTVASTATSIVSRLAGFNGRGNIVLSREELLEQGVSSAEADAIAFQAHEDEVLQLHFLRWIWFICVVILLTMPVFLSLFTWLLVEFSVHRNNECGSPLHTYCIGAIVVFSVKMLNSFLIRCFCCWAPERDNDLGTPESPPTRVRVYRVVLELFIFVWHCVGLAWAVGDAADAKKGLPSCADAAPELLSSVTVFSIFNIAIALFMTINIVGLRRVLQIIYRNGLLCTPQAAPAGTLKKSTEPVDASALERHVQEHPCCPICMEEYVVGDGRAREVLMVRRCGHVYHRQCLEGWMNVNRTCPLCRVDLTGDSEPAGSGAPAGSEAGPPTDARGTSAAAT